MIILVFVFIIDSKTMNAMIVVFNQFLINFETHKNLKFLSNNVKFWALRSIAYESKIEANFFVNIELEWFFNIIMSQVVRETTRNDEIVVRFLFEILFDANVIKLFESDDDFMKFISKRSKIRMILTREWWLKRFCQKSMNFRCICFWCESKKFHRKFRFFFDLNIQLRNNDEKNDFWNEHSKIDYIKNVDDFETINCDVVVIDRNVIAKEFAIDVFIFEYEIEKKIDENLENVSNFDVKKKHFFLSRHFKTISSFSIIAKFESKSSIKTSNLKTLISNTKTKKSLQKYWLIFESQIQIEKWAMIDASMIMRAIFS